MAAISEPAIGNEDDEDPFDDLPFTARGTGKGRSGGGGLSKE